ncbi:hypothetical protein DER45DRAFT_49468 [Fusarium avenaceum]|nr:hypothetical protein DER45DRAFT_49468 [Fusarium avenaceum]
MIKMKQSKSTKHSSGRRGSSSSQPNTSFLFMVNKLLINRPDTDLYHHHVPPRFPSQYDGEVPSKVMRYYNGEVTEAADFYWYRDAENSGRLAKLDSQRNCMMDQFGQYRYAVEYKSFGVAACNPLLPIMVVAQDPLTSETAYWELLRIFHPPTIPGLSQAVTINSNMGEGGGPVPYIAGRSPSWMPSLLPSTYRSPNRNPPRSLGLGGELPIVLGLMALYAPQDTNNTSIDNVFLGHNRVWRHGVWNSNEPPRGHPPTASEDPKGFVVKVFLDPDNLYSTPENLRSLEWEAAIVRET